jgi:hypothetical protein
VKAASAGVEIAVNALRSDENISRRQGRRIRLGVVVTSLVTIGLLVTACGGGEQTVGSHEVTRGGVTMQGAKSRVINSGSSSRGNSRGSGSTQQPNAVTPKRAAWSAALLAGTLRDAPGAMVRAASCQSATAAQRYQAPFGPEPGPVFECQITVDREPPASFDVQALANGCFVAERHRPGRAIYGCEEKA